MARQKLVIGNWKMNTTLGEAIDLAGAIAAGVKNTTTGVAICVPFPWLLPVGERVKDTKVALGAQNCHFQKSGAFTGEVSTGMLIETGCQYVIIGHSERRHGLGESDELINQKTKAALGAGLKVIFCLGELLGEREANLTETILDRQVTQGLKELPHHNLANLIVAYEPVWAIGTGKVATPEQAQQAHAFLRVKLATQLGEQVARTLPLLYGGSVTADSASVLFSEPDVDGGLIGGASLKADSFLKIVAAIPHIE